MSARGSFWRRTAIGIAVAIAAIVVVSAVILPLQAHVPVRALTGLYLVAMLPVAVRWGLVPALSMAVLSMLTFDYLFTPPLFHLTLTDPYTLATVVISAVTAYVVSGLAGRLQHRATQAESLAAEQAALRRVATLVARAASPSVVFAAVAEEAGRLLDADATVLSRYETDGAVTVVGSWGRPGSIPSHPAVDGARPDSHAVTTRVQQTHRPVRVDDHGADGPGAAANVDGATVHSAVGVPIEVEGTVWGALSVAARRTEPLPRDAESRLAGFTELVATAIANAENRKDLIASRSRIVETADTTRRRIERDLHDGTQQRLVAVALQLRAAQGAVPFGSDDALRAHLQDLAAELTGVIDELREIAHGIHPAALMQGGLRPALGGLARRSGIPVDLEVRVDRRLPEPVEVAAYYVVSEALTNAAKHAAATRVQVRVTADDDVLAVDVSDDGRGGARFVPGSGLMGIKDRVEAVGGRVTMRSPPGEGSRLSMTLPLAGGDREGAASGMLARAPVEGRPSSQGSPVG